MHWTGISDARVCFSPYHSKALVVAHHSWHWNAPAQNTSQQQQLQVQSRPLQGLSQISGPLQHQGMPSVSQSSDRSYLECQFLRV